MALFAELNEEAQKQKEALQGNANLKGDGSIKGNKNVTKIPGNKKAGKQGSKGDGNETIKEVLKQHDNKTSLEEEIKASMQEINNRKTISGTYEIFEDQNIKMQELKVAYLKKTGGKTSLNRIIQEALDTYLPTLEKLLNE